MAEDHENRDESRDAAAQLIMRARAGDSTAFDRIIVAHQRRVLSLAWRLLGNQDDARDAAQEAFLRVYRHLEKFDASLDFSGWLYRIVVNVCRDQARKRGNHLSSYEAGREAGTIAEPASPHDTEAAAMAAEEQSMILKALARLTEKERAAIVLRDLEGLPTGEVARILGSSPATIRSQISSARVKLKAFRDRQKR
ncbi:MAG: RNA polymerase sigma factor [Blastocatellia bacterium]